MTYVKTYEDFLNERRPLRHPLINQLMQELTRPIQVPDPADRNRENIFASEIDEKRLDVAFVTQPNKTADTGVFEIRDERNKLLYTGIDIQEIIDIIQSHIPIGRH
ncbi:hypothetical protein EBU94_02360 [bacterium]|nr:hypothetical protein [bacterium]